MYATIATAAAAIGTATATDIAMRGTTDRASRGATAVRAAKAGKMQGHAAPKAPAAKRRAPTKGKGHVRKRLASSSRFVPIEKREASARNAAGAAAVGEAAADAMAVKAPGTGRPT